MTKQKTMNDIWDEHEEWVELAGIYSDLNRSGVKMTYARHEEVAIAIKALNSLLTKNIGSREKPLFPREIIKQNHE